MDLFTQIKYITHIVIWQHSQVAFSAVFLIYKWKIPLNKLQLISIFSYSFLDLNKIVKLAFSTDIKPVKSNKKYGLHPAINH